MTEKNADIVQMIETLRPRMTSCVWRILKNDDDVEDVVQEALEKILKRVDAILQHPNHTALILRICINQAFDHLRRRRRWWRFNELFVRMRPSGFSLSPADAYTQKEKHARLLNAISRLTRREAEAIILRAVEELSYSEIAISMECRESTVRVLISKARRRLEKILVKENDANLSMEAKVL